MPGVPGAFALTRLLSAAECANLRSVSEAIGYRPDVPLSSAVDERAQNVVLMASEEQNDALFQRCQACLPQELQGSKLCGLNRRWRLYRYNAGNLYRKHLDGAWPASGVRTGADGRKEYVYDAHGGAARSRLTFIVYLNDDFEGGATTFFVPKPGDEGVLESRPVKPNVGCATVFQHGDTGIPLLHEGSSVLKGAKYLLRTDVLYRLPETSEAAKQAKRKRGLVRQLGGASKVRLEDGDFDADGTNTTKGNKKKKVINTKLKKNSTPSTDKVQQGNKKLIMKTRKNSAGKKCKNVKMGSK